MALLKENNMTANDEFVDTRIPKKNYLVKVDGVTDRYQKLKMVHQLQKSLVEQSTHKAMSPISAISGYLELINLSLYDDETDVNKIADYQKKIKRGIEEVSHILEQLQDIYQEEISEEIESPMLNVDLNWIIREQCDKVKASSLRTITFDDSAKPIYVRTNLLMSKLMIHNLLNYVLKNSLTDSNIHLSTQRKGAQSLMVTKFEVPDEKRQELDNLISKNEVDTKDLSLYTEGVKKSIALAQQINGSIILEKEEGKTLYLHLALPTAPGVV